MPLRYIMIGLIAFVVGCILSIVVVQQFAPGSGGDAVQAPGDLTSTPRQMATGRQ